MALEFQGRDTVLLLRQQEHRQEPGRQGQLGAREQRAGRQRGLVAARVALQQPTALVSDRAVRRGAATRAGKAVGPARRRHRSGALLLGAEAALELWHRQAGLKLDSVHRHQRLLVSGAASVEVH